MSGRRNKALRTAAIMLAEASETLDPIAAYKAAKKRIKRMNRRERTSALAGIRELGGEYGKNQEG